MRTAAAYLSSLFHRWFGTRSNAAGAPVLAQLQAQESPTAGEGIIESSPTPAVPIDENMLERARTQWQFGDWQSLAAISRDALQHHPDRAKLALLAAAGHQQLGDQAAARQFTRLAQDWGCSRKLVAQVLISGAHNTLAKAAAVAGQVPRALKHFQASIATGSPNTDLALATQARVAHQWTNLGAQVVLPSLDIAIASTSGWLTGPVVSLGSALNPTLAPLTNELQQHRTEFSRHVQTLNNLSKHLDWLIRDRATASARQVESFLNIQRLLDGKRELPQLHGWPVSPDFAYLTLDLIRRHDYSAVIEFGSGSSTVLICDLLNSSTMAGRSKPYFVSFEHSIGYFEKTLAELQSRMVESVVSLIHAPLTQYVDEAKNEQFQFYDCASALQNTLNSIQGESRPILAIVDGPPGNVAPYARYPALSVLKPVLNQHDLHILMDDYFRPEEKKIVNDWKLFLEDSGYEFDMEEMDLDKGAVILRINKA